MKFSSDTVVRSSVSDRVLVIMAKAPRPGTVKTRLSPSLSPEAVIDFYCCLLDDTLALARSLGDVQVAIMCPESDVKELAELAGDATTARTCRVPFSKKRSKRSPHMTWLWDQRMTAATISLERRLLILCSSEATEWAPGAHWRDSYRAPENFGYL